MKYYFALPFKDRKGKYQTALDSFIEPFKDYISTNITNDEIEIFIVEQSGGLKYDNHDEELFNLGRTINIGFDLYKEVIKNNDAFFFHPIDLLPVDVDYNIQYTTKFCCQEHSPDGAFYKSMGFVAEDFIKVNGFNNDMWGWGGEDDELLKRFTLNNITTGNKINNYIKLCNDGNGLVDSDHYMPTHSTNLDKLKFLNSSLDCFNNGLTTLTYELIDKVEYKGLQRYIIK
jgi:hypothetical protein